MKINKNYFILILISHVFFSQTSLKANYVLINTFNTKLNKETLQKEHPKIAEKYFDNAIAMLENTKDKKAIFQLIVKNSLCSFVLQQKKEMESGFNMAFISAQVEGNYFTNLNTSNIVNYKKNKGSDFLINYNKEDVKWTITDEQKKIANYDCYKATTYQLDAYPPKEIRPRPLDVWFCPSIPIKAGPYQYSNLPGLVILLTDNKTFTMYLQNLELNPKEIEVEKPPTKGVKMNITEYLKYQLKNL